MNKNVIKAPSRRQVAILRVMIIIGLVCMGFFMKSLFRDAVVGYRPLYLFLLFTFLFTFFKIAYEWYHYWSIRIPETPPTTRAYTVDILTTFCPGEPYEMIVKTLTAMQAITYPHNSFLCDEADDLYLKSVCERLGVHHVTRSEKIDAKAGNINNALKLCKGELCVILDPDHIPVSGFLDPIVSHFDDPEIGFVQIVQAYYNQYASWIAKGAAQQTYQFYGPMMMCMNSYGTVQAIGANCTFRRAALDSIGGHAAGLAEDMHTAMQLHAKKWKSVYVPVVLTRGLVPATLSAYYKQQLKWSRGVFELFVTAYIKLFTRFSWRQKLHYGLLPFFYFSGFIFLINFLIPVIALVTAVFPLRMDFSEFLIISIPFISAVILIRHYVQQWVMEDDERGFHLNGGLLLIGTWWVFILGIIYTVVRKDVPYIATPKEIKDEKNLHINLPNIFVLVISLLAIIYGLYSDWNPFTIFMAGIVSLNCLFMIVILIASSELKMQGYISSKNRISKINLHIGSLKKYFWLFRRKVYSGVRRVSLLLTILIICVSIYASKYTGDDSTDRIIQAGRYKIKPEPMGSSMFDENAIDKIGLRTPTYFSNVRGVIYSKGASWYRNIYPLTKKIIFKDFEEMKLTGINSVKIYGPNIYDRTIINIAADNKIGIYYSFWIADFEYFMEDFDQLNALSDRIIKTVTQLKSNPNIKSWNLGNTTFQQIMSYDQTPKGQLIKKYTQWLKQLISKIKATDNSRNITIDVLASSNLMESINLLHHEIPQIDAFGVVIKSKSAARNIKDNLGIPYFISSIDSRVLGKVELPVGSIFYANWQDQQSANIVTFDGLKDIWGHNKPILYRISNVWKGKIQNNALPPIKILKPAITAFEGNSLPYRALVYEEETWKLASVIPSGMQFEWYLVKTDRWGDALTITPIDKGSIAHLLIPKDANRHFIYLVAIKGNNSTEYRTTLNTPLIN